MMLMNLRLYTTKPGRTGNWEDPCATMCSRSVCLIGTKFADFIMARGQCTAYFEAEHMTAPDKVADLVIFSLHRRGRPHMSRGKFGRW